jgi:hypothetical protein
MKDQLQQLVDEFGAVKVLETLGEIIKGDLGKRVSSLAERKKEEEARVLDLTAKWRDQDLTADEILEMLEQMAR